MKKIEVEIYSEAVNAAVVRLPGRKFPGIVIQSDSLRILLDSASEIAELCSDSTISELADSALEVVRLLRGYTEVYEKALQEHNVALPY